MVKWWVKRESWIQFAVGAVICFLIVGGMVKVFWPLQFDGINFLWSVPVCVAIALFALSGEWFFTVALQCWHYSSIDKYGVIQLNARSDLLKGIVLASILLAFGTNLGKLGLTRKRELYLGITTALLMVGTFRWVSRRLKQYGRVYQFIGEVIHKRGTLLVIYRAGGIFSNTRRTMEDALRKCGWSSIRFKRWQIVAVDERPKQQALELAWSNGWSADSQLDLRKLCGSA